MPGFDGTGPGGRGPMTGGGRGYCVNPIQNRYMGYGQQWGCGFGYGYRGGRGFGRGRGFTNPNFQNFSQPYPYNQARYQLTAEEEKEDLRSYIEGLEEQLKEAKEYLKSLDAKADK